MAGTDPASGSFEPHGNVVQPIDASATPAVQRPSAIVPASDSPANVGPQVGGVWDGAADFAAVAAAGEADCAAAMSYAMDTRNGMLAHYQAGIMGLGSPAIDQMVLPRVPEDASGSATPPAGGYLYGSGEGDQPGRGDAFGGNEPA